MGSIQSVQQRINAFFAGEVELNEPLLRDTPKQDSGMNLRMSIDKDLLAEGHPWRKLRLEFWYEQYQRAYEQGWARNPEKIYTKKDCLEYNIDVPTHDILNYLNVNFINLSIHYSSIFIIQNILIQYLIFIVDTL